MGKGNRSRADHAAEIIENSAPALTKKQKKTNIVTGVVIVLVALLIAGAILISAAVNNGWFQRAKTAVSSDHFKITGTMMSYYVQAYYNQNIAQYASYYGIDSNKTLNDQEISEGVTWFDYIASLLQEQLKQKLAFCEGAKADNIKLEDKENETIDEQMDTLGDVAAQYLLDVNSYCTQLFGAGVKSKDVRAALEIDALASKYYEKLYDENEEDLKKDGSDEVLKKYAEEKPESFLSANTLQYAFKAALTTEGAEATQAEKDAYAADKATMLGKANAILSGAVSEEAFKAAVIEDLCGESAHDVFKTAYDTAFKSVSAENTPDSSAIDAAEAKILEYCKKVMQGDKDAAAPDFGSETGAKQFATVCDSVYSSLVTNGYETMEQKVTYSDPTGSSATDLAKWLFADGRTAGDTEVISNEGDTASTYTVVFVKETAKLDETPVRDVAHILVSSSAQADDILNKYKAGEQTLDAFKALGENVTEDSSIVYENVMKGDMVAEFNDWLFDESRKEGDTGIVQTDYGYHVMYYIGEGEATWKHQAREAIVNERLTDWCTAAYDKYGIKTNEKFFVNMA